jgi:hypothetical protein
LDSGSKANRGRVVDREELNVRRDCQLDAGKPRRTGQPNPDKPRRMCRLEADAYVEENGWRSGEIYLDTTFHRRG